MESLEQQLGFDHPDVGKSLNILATVYAEQDRHADAEAALKRSISILEKALSPDHPDVAQSLNNLAWQYALQDQYQNAISILRRVVDQNRFERNNAFQMGKGSPRKEGATRKGSEAAAA